jgi:hypothetical protein
MIRGEATAYIETCSGKFNHQERCSLSRRKDTRNKERETDYANQNKHDFDGSPPARLEANSANKPIYVQLYHHNRKQSEKQHALTPHEKSPDDSFPVQDPYLGVDDDAISNIGINFYTIRLPMVTRMPVKPPPITNANKSVSDDMPQNGAAKTRIQDLAVSDVVAEESEVSKDDPEQQGHYHLPPCIAKKYETGEEAD